MDIDILAKALENDSNLDIINTNIQEIKSKKNDILQQIGLNRDKLKDYHKKLINYRYVDSIKDLKYGETIRWINLNRLDKIKITNGSILCDIKITDKGIALVLKTHINTFITLYLNENLLFQYISNEERAILNAIKCLSK